MAGHRRRLDWLIPAYLAGGLLAVLVFTTTVSPWIIVALAFGAGGMTTISTAVLPTLLMELAGNSQTTATGMFAVSNQVGVFGGASIGGAILALGDFPMLGFFCLGGAIVAAVVVRLKVRDSAEFLERIALMESGAG